MLVQKRRTKHCRHRGRRHGYRAGEEAGETAHLKKKRKLVNMVLPRIAFCFGMIISTLASLAAHPGTTAPSKSSAAGGGSSVRPPDIVLFIADDLSWHDIGPYGGSDVRTPNFDRLEKELLKFEQAFAASPTCTPSRSAMYTGLYPVRNGAHANHSFVRDGTRSLPAYIKPLGVSRCARG
jgi:hypothetical protein